MFSPAVSSENNHSVTVGVAKVQVLGGDSSVGGGRHLRDHKTIRHVDRENVSRGMFFQKLCFAQTKYFCFGKKSY